MLTFTATFAQILVAKRTERTSCPPKAERSTIINQKLITTTHTYFKLQTKQQNYELHYRSSCTSDIR